VTLTIYDKGVGALTPPAVRLGGLAGLRDRLAAAGGELAIERQRDGFRVVATVPGATG
jgi:two-component system sensor histidine kinase DesK